MVLKCQFRLKYTKNKHKQFCIMNDYYDLDDIETQLYNQVYHSNIQPTDEELRTLSQEIIPVEVRRKSVNRYYQNDSKKVSGTMMQKAVIPCNYKYDFKKRRELQKMTFKIKSKARKAKTLVTKLKRGTLNGDVSYEKLYEAQKRATNLMVNATRKCKPLLRQIRLCCKNKKCTNSHRKPENELIFHVEQRYESRQKGRLKTPENSPKPEKLPQIQENHRQASNPPPTEVITLSDSDDDDNCVLVSEQWPFLCISDSDDDSHIKVEKDLVPYKRPDSDKLKDDVIFVEPEPIKTVIINLDDIETNQKSDLEPKESTMDSNDFLDNSNVELGDNFKFNFSLHGSDFHNENFVKPTKPDNNEHDETESSTASTTDLNLLKTVVFNEVEFPKEDIFSEANLETFGNLITPNRSTSTPKLADTDLPEDLPNKVKNKAKDLPNLSPMHELSTTKEKKRKSNKSSNEDLVVPQKKKNKSKKKRNLTEELEELNEKSDNNENVSITKKKKKKKKVSSESPSETNENSEVKLTENSEMGDNKDCNVIEDEKNDDFRDLVVIDEVIDGPVEVNSDESVLSELVMENCSIKLGNLKTTEETVENYENTEKFTRQRFQDHWNSDKDVFYQTMVNVENFNVDNVKKTMSNDPNLWQILDLDKTSLQIVSNKDKRCKKCSEFGHTALKCRERNYGPAKCRLCGLSGHFEPRCPNKICNQCGKAGNYSTRYCQSCFKWRKENCNECGQTGHISRNCPDLWRRYHSTTENGPIVSFQDSCLKSKEKLWCCGCARKGHLEHNCTYYSQFYPPSNPEIKSYEDVYRKHEKKPQSPKNKNLAVQKPKNIYQNQKSSTYVPPSVPPVIPPLIPPLMPPNNAANESFPMPLPLQNSSFNNPSLLPPLMPNPWLLPFTNNLAQNYGLLAFRNFQNNFINLPIPQIVPNPANKLIFQVNNQQNNQDQEPFNREQITYNHLSKGYKVFSSESVNNIQQFLSSEFRKLSQFQMQLKRSELVSLHKQTIWMESNRSDSETYFRKLNMILFGIYQMRMGKDHLNKLKQFKLIHPKSMLSKSKRLDLYNSYNYIFGSDKHTEENYSHLLNSLIIS